MLKAHLMSRLYQLEICAVLYASPTESCSSPVTSLCVSVYRRGAGGVGPHLHRAPKFAMDRLQQPPGQFET